MAVMNPIVSTSLADNLTIWIKEDGIDSAQENVRIVAATAIKSFIEKDRQGTLDLSEKNLTSLPEGLERIKKLRTLNLSGNDLKAYPPGLINLHFNCSVLLDCSAAGQEFMKERAFVFLHEEVAPRALKKQKNSTTTSNAPSSPDTWSEEEGVELEEYNKINATKYCSLMRMHENRNTKRKREDMIRTLNEAVGDSQLMHLLS